MASSPDSKDDSATLKPGVYAPPKPTDLRSCCPAVNSLANHGYIPRDGRNVTASAFKAGMDEYGLGQALGSLLSYPPVLNERQPPRTHRPLSTLLTNPLQYLTGAFGMRTPGEFDPKTGAPVLQLDQLAEHGIIEHDVSLSRRDIGQGDNSSPQPDLIAQILAASSDGKSITIHDFVALRQRRYVQQKEDNPKLDFGDHQLFLGCAEIALILKVFGDGEKIPLSYMKAWFHEERLPRDEGWRKRKWWSVGLLEIFALAGKIKNMTGPEGKA